MNAPWPRPIAINIPYTQSIFSANTDRSNMALQVASIGFYKAGKLLNRAKKELNRPKAKDIANVLIDIQ